VPIYIPFSVTVPVYILISVIVSFYIPVSVTVSVYIPISVTVSHFELRMRGRSGYVFTVVRRGYEIERTGLGMVRIRSKNIMQLAKCHHVSYYEA